MSSAKKQYEIFCQQAGEVPIFCQHWWLDAVCGPEHWDVSLARNGEKVIGALPYFKSRRLGFILLNMPKLTSHWGPLIIYPSDQKYSTRLSFEHQVMSELISGLPSFDYFNQRFRNTISNALPFFWKEFKLIGRYSYQLNNISNHEVVWENFNSNTRSQIRKAQNLVRAEQANDRDEGYPFFESSFKRQGIQPPFSYESFSRLDAACVEQGRRKILVARDNDQKICAAIYIVWDRESAYYLLGGYDEGAVGGAFSLLMWEAIKFASTVSVRFDFEGSMLEPVERFFRSFGAEQTPYHQVQKINSPLLRFASALNLISN